MARKKLKCVFCDREFDTHHDRYTHMVKEACRG